VLLHEVLQAQLLRLSFASDVAAMQGLQIEPVRILCLSYAAATSLALEIRNAEQSWS